MIAVLLLSLGIVACADNESPTEPSNAGVVAVLITAPLETVLGNSAPQQLQARATFRDGHQEDVTTRAEWRSSNPIVASVSANGQLVGVSDGSTTISAIYQDVTGVLPITVAPDSLTLIAATPTQNSTLARGATVTFDLAASYGLKSRDAADVELVFRDQNDRDLKRGAQQRVTRGSAPIRLTDTFQIPTDPTVTAIRAWMLLIPVNRGGIETRAITTELYPIS